MTSVDTITTRNAAIAFSKSLHQSGAPIAEISKKLAERGYVGLRTKKPLAKGAVYSLLRSKKKKAHRAAPQVQASHKAKGLRLSEVPSMSAVRKLELMKQLLSMKELGAETRISACLLML